MSVHLPTLIQVVKEYAAAHYEDGWDVILEALDDVQLRNAFHPATTLAEAIANLQPIVDVRREQQANAGVPEAERELELGRQDVEHEVYQGLVTDPVEIFGVGVDTDADAAVLRNPLGHHLPGFTVDGPVCAACTSELHRPGTRRSQVHHVSVAAVRLCAQRRAEVDEDEQEVNAEYQAELAYERYLENGGAHAAAIQADLEEERRREGW